MQWLNPGKQGYQYLNSKFNNTKEHEKNDIDFSRNKLVDVLGWVNSETTLYYTNVLTQEKERMVSKVQTCEEKELKYLQGKIDGLKLAIKRIESLGDTARKQL